MRIPMNRWVWVGLLGMGLAIAVAQSGRITKLALPGSVHVVAPAASIPAGAAPQAPQATPGKAPENLSDTPDPDCQQARDLLQAGADSQG